MISNKILRIIIHVYLILLIGMPFNYSYNPNLGNWETTFLFEDYFSLLIISPLFLFWFIYQFSTKKWSNVLLKLLVLISSAFNSFCAFTAITMLVQDFSPGIGCLFLLLHFPIMLIYFRLEEKSKLNEEKIEYHDILDSEF